MLRPGQAYGPYTLVRKLGTGGFGEVWLAEKRSAATGLAFRYALKIALGEEAVAGTFVKEVMSWVAASGHPNVLSIVDADVWEGLPCIVGEYCPEGSLSDWLRAHDGGAPSLEAAVDMASGILEGLAHLHERGVLHGDLKPVNILLQGRKPRIADFGLARVLLSSRHRSTVAGTPVYMAPEAFDGVSTVQTDIWSAGVILYQLVEKRLPYPQGSPAVVMKAMLTREPDPLSPSTPVGLRRVIERALAREPERRYPSAEAMRAGLRAWEATPAGEEAALGSSALFPRPAPPSGTLAERPAGSDPDETGRVPWPPPPKEGPEGVEWPETPTLRQPLEEMTVRDLPPAPVRGKTSPPARSGWKRRLLAAAGLLVALLPVILQDRARPAWPGGNPAAEPSAAPPARVEAIGPKNSPGKPAGPAAISAQPAQSPPAVTVAPESRKGLPVAPAAAPGPVRPEVSPAPSASAAQGPPPGASPPPAAGQSPPPSPGNQASARLGLRFVRIPAGSFAVATPDGSPPRRVTVRRPFEMQATEVTQAQWQAVMGSNPSGFRGGSLPVENVSLAEVQVFLQKLNALDPGRRYRLPTAAEWEYACRAGRTGGRTADPGAVAWHDGNAGNRTHPVRQKRANPFGLHDMLGNVWELCEDRPSRPPSATAAPAEESPPGPQVSLRGGSWGYEAGSVAPANRPGNQAGLRGNDIGFRLVRDPSPAPAAARGPKGKR